ncbi:MAG: TIGR03013 family XrtA/PEP-CTERM system glycosyltransferase [Thermodesulfobacteriota bacterium]
MKATPARYSFLIFLGDILLTLAATQVSSLIRFEPGFNVFAEHTGATVFTIVIYLISLYILDLYELSQFSMLEISSRILGAVILAGTFSMLVFYTLPHWRFGRGIFLIQLAFSWIGYLLWRVALKNSVFRRAVQQPVIIVGARECSRDVIDVLESSGLSFQLLGFLEDEPCTPPPSLSECPLLGRPNQLESVLTRHSDALVVLAKPEYRDPKLIQQMLDAKMKGFEVIDIAVFYEQLAGRIPIRYLRDEWLLCAEGFRLVSRRVTQKIKRIMDIGFAVLLLVLSSPLWVFTALAIVLESRGPVFYRQKRVGWKGRVFDILKFRSMVADAEALGRPVWASEGDPRITRVGRIIRALRIDELPQIINILKGDMSLIGPRPERPEFVAELERQIPYYGLRHSVPPGVTGWAQVNYPYGASIEDTIRKLEYDLYYIKNMSFYLDLKICLLTVGVVFWGHGAR